MPSNAIVIENLKFSYADRLILKGINLNIKPGEIFGLVGPNGAGKTTMLECIMGLHSLGDKAGNISVYGNNPKTKQSRKLIGSMLQGDIRVERVKVKEYLEMIANQNPDSESVNQIILELNLNEISNKYLNKLSGGQLRKVTFAASVINKPKILFLDEPTVGMDADVRNDFWNYVMWLKKRGTTVIVTSHYLEEIQNMADRIGILLAGRFEYIGTWNDLSEQNFGGNIRFSTSIPLNVFKNLNSTRKLTAFNNKVTIYTDDTDKTLRDLLPFIDELAGITISHKSLESVFSDMTKQEDL